MPSQSDPRVAQPIQGVLFDKDGTLFDFTATWTGVIEAMLERFAPDVGLRSRMAADAGFDTASRQFLPGSPIVAGATSGVARVWARHRPDLGAERIEREANAMALDIAAAPGFLIPAVPDLPGFLDGLAARGLALGVATHDSEAGARAQLSHVGALDRFGFIAGYDSGYEPKPAPAMLHAFADTTGIDPAGVVMVGDSVHDLAMVEAAGAALAIGVLTGPARHKDLAPYAHHVLPSIAALPAILDASDVPH